MSERNAELAQRFQEAIAARRVPEEILAPDFVMENVATAVTNRTYRGAEGVRQWMEDFFGVLKNARYETELTDVGEDYLIAKLRISGEGLVSGAPVDLPHWGVMRIRDGKIARATGYATRAEALRAVGLTK